MSLDVNTLQTHLKYTDWASGRLVEAASILKPEELSKDFGTADRSVLGTLVHLYAANRVWLSRVKGEVPGPYIVPERDMHLSVLQSDWPPLRQAWLQWTSGLTNDSLNDRISYRDLKGQPHQTPIWQIILHLVNHDTHHRGQVSGFLRALGHTPPVLDLIAYYRSH